VLADELVEAAVAKQAVAVLVDVDGRVSGRGPRRRGRGGRESALALHRACEIVASLI
jgi:hypothetical protein